MNDQLDEIEQYALEKYSIQIQKREEADEEEEVVRCNSVAMAWRGMVNKIRDLQGREDLIK